MNPTVSVRSTCCFPGRSSILVVGSSVAKSLSSSKTSASVRWLRSVDLPAFVYPTIAITGILFFSLLALIICLCCCTSLSSLRSCAIRSFISLLSISSFFSPGPLVPIPPPRRDIDFPSPESLLSLYLSCASSTWIFPSLVAALAANISRMTSVRSITFVSRYCSKFLSCAGDSSSSQTMPVAPVLSTSCAISATFPVPTYVPGCIFSLLWISDPTTVAPAVFTSSASSNSESSASSPSCSLTPTSITLSSTSSIFILSAINYLVSKN